MKKVISGVLLIIMVLSFWGCSNQSSESINLQTTTNLNEEETNPFEISEKESIDYSMGHGVNKPDPDKRVIEYTGQPIEIQYFFDNGPAECSSGLFVFVNGFLQPYRVDGDVEKEFYVFPLASNEQKTVNITFEPVCGEAGETLSVYFASMLNPKVIKYTDDFKYFGHNHKISQLLPWKLEYKKSCKNAAQEKSIDSKEIKYTKFTTEFLMNNARNIDTTIVSEFWVEGQNSEILLLI